MEIFDRLFIQLNGLTFNVLRLPSNLQDLKPNWLPKADIPSSVPKLPIEYVHRHRLMKQVVSCLLDQCGAGPRDTDDEAMVSVIVCVVVVVVVRAYLAFLTELRSTQLSRAILL